MRIRENQGFISIHIDGAKQDFSLTDKKEQSDGQTGRTSFQMNANPQALNSIAQKKEQAKNQAMKLVKDAYASDLVLDEDMDARRNRIQKLRTESEEASARIREYETQKERLKEEYGVEPDSAEQKDLELLEKRRELAKKGMGGALTLDERKRLAEIEKAGLTEYQSRCLEIDNYMEPDKEIVEKNRNAIREENAVIRATKIERLKVRPMLEATQAADEIMDAASEEALGALVAEGQAYLDEKEAEAQEKAEEKKEEEEEKEERAEAVREYKEQIKEVTEMAVETDQIRSDIQEEVRKMLEKLGLTEEDVKGVAVDEIL